MTRRAHLVSPPHSAFHTTDALLTILCSQRPFTHSHAAVFRRLVIRYYRACARNLPWRLAPTPYRVLVSEIMLQQTQVPRVRLFFPRFLTAFPSFSALARAPLAAVLQAWNGLGYNRRALALQRIAQIVTSTYAGRLPSDPALLARLPGIGPATAASIAAFAFNRPTLFLETNIRAVFIHYFFPHKKSVDDAQLIPLLALTLDRKNPRRWYNALMDLGTAIKETYGNPTRRSNAYRPQSPFSGSSRQLRGLVLRALLSRPASLTSLASFCHTSPPILRSILDSLIRDGLITFSRNLYHLA